MTQSTEKVAILYVYPNDENLHIYTQKELTDHFNGPVKKFWQEQSYGRYTCEASVFVWKLPVDSTKTDRKHGHYVVDMLKAVLPDGGNIEVPGYKPDDFARTLILLGGGVYGFGGGMGSKDLRVNGKEYKAVSVGSFTYFHPDDKHYSENLRFGYYEEGSAFRGHKSGETTGYPSLGLRGGDGTLLHEWGHGLGLSTHANYWHSEREPLYGKIYWWNKKDSLWDQDGDYGNLFDIMGGNPQYSLHINAFYKELLGWLQPSEKKTVTSSTKDIRLAPLESQETGKVKCLQYAIPANTFVRPEPFMNDADYSFYVEYRRPIGLDVHLGHEYLRGNTEGLLVCLTRRKGEGFRCSWLLDMSPDDTFYENAPAPATATDIMSNTYYRVDDHHEASLNAGRAFYDDETGFCLTNIRPDGDEGVDFDVELGKKVGVESGVHVTALFSGDGLEASGAVVLFSNNLAYKMRVEGGKAVISQCSDGSEVWSSDVGLDQVSFLDGNLAYEKGGSQVWQSDTGGHADARLVVGDDGKLRILDATGQIIWPEVDLGGGKGEKEILKKVSKEMLAKIEGQGMPLNGGDNPPNVEGSYLMNNFLLKSSLVPGDAIGAKYLDLKVTLSDQQAHEVTLAIEEGTKGDKKMDGVGSFIVGEGKDFSIAAELTYHYGEAEGKFIGIISGTMEEKGIASGHYANFCLKHDDKYNWIAVGTGRVFKDNDGFSEKS